MELQIEKETSITLNISNKELARFQKLIAEHKSANHRLFSVVETAAKNGTLTAEYYNLFAINIATRTMLSLPEIHACCIQASLDLDPLRTSYSVMTGAEEGGFGKPKEVHTILMMNALNYHSKIVFGSEPIDLKYLMALVRLLHASKKYKYFLQLKTKYQGIQEDLELYQFINTDELIDICTRMSAIAGITLPNEIWESVDEIENLEKTAYFSLIDLNVLNETIEYCIAQLDVLGNMKTGYLQGVGFAHEGLADGMIHKLFKVLYAQIKTYSSEQEFMNMVYPYFAAHGNYIEVYEGLATDTEGVEVTHAKRELEKLAQLDKNALNTAWTGANDFANRNVRIWDGILDVIEFEKFNKA